MSHPISSRPRNRVVTLFAAVLVAVFALAGCSHSLRAGDALAVGGTTVTADHVDRLLTDYLRETNQTDADSATITQLRQALINNLALDELTSIAARQVGVTVTAGEVSKQTDAQLAAPNYADVAKQYVIPRALLPDMIRASLERTAIGDKLAGVKSTTQANAQKSQTSMSNYLVKLAGQQDVWVNPIYGSWDASKLAVSGNGALVQTGSGGSATNGS